MNSFDRLKRLTNGDICANELINMNSTFTQLHELTGKCTTNAFVYSFIFFFVVACRISCVYYWKHNINKQINEQNKVYCGLCYSTIHSINIRIHCVTTRVRSVAVLIHKCLKINDQFNDLFVPVSCIVHFFFFLRWGNLSSKRFTVNGLHTTEKGKIRKQMSICQNRFRNDQWVFPENKYNIYIIYFSRSHQNVASV